MKRLMALALSLAAIICVGANAEAKAADSSIYAANLAATGGGGVAAQWRDNYRWRRGINRRARVVTQTRFVRYGRRIFRETYQVRYLPNGRTQVRLISRVRVR